MGNCHGFSPGMLPLQKRLLLVGELEAGQCVQVQPPRQSNATPVLLKFFHEVVEFKPALETSERLLSKTHLLCT